MPTPNIHHQSEATMCACGEPGLKAECMRYRGGPAVGEFFGFALGVCDAEGFTIM